MSERRTAGAVALAAAAAAVAVYAATGQVPDAPAGGTCYVAWGVGPCEAAQALAADPADVDCEPGDPDVHAPLELVADPDGGVDGAALPVGFAAIAGETLEVACSSLTRSARALTVVPLAKHGRRRRDADGNEVAGAPLCPPVVLAGRAPRGCE